MEKLLELLRDGKSRTVEMLALELNTGGYYSQPNRALAARLRATTYGLRWVLPIAEGDF